MEINLERMSEEPKKKSNFLYGDFFGGYMSKVSLRTQYEGSMIGCTLIILSLIFMIFNWIFSPLTLGWKIFYIFNAVSGLLILWSSVVTTFQQYQAYMETQSVIDLLKGGNEEKW
jgi:hypothetical protein